MQQNVYFHFLVGLWGSRFYKTLLNYDIPLYWFGQFYANITMFMCTKKTKNLDPVLSVEETNSISCLNHYH